MTHHVYCYLLIDIVDDNVDTLKSLVMMIPDRMNMNLKVPNLNQCEQIFKTLIQIKQEEEKYP
jgi:hypothetical protein